MKCKIKNYIQKNPFIVIIIHFIVGKVGVDMDFGVSILDMTIHRLVLGTLMFAMMYLIMGKNALTWKKRVEDTH